MVTENLLPPDGTAVLSTAAPVAPTKFAQMITGLRHRLLAEFKGSPATFEQVFGELAHALRGAVSTEQEEPLLESIDMRVLFYLLWAVRERTAATVSVHGLAASIGSRKMDNAAAAAGKVRGILLSKGIEMSADEKIIRLKPRAGGVQGEE